MTYPYDPACPRCGPCWRLGVAVLMLATGAAAAEERYPVRSTIGLTNRAGAVTIVLREADDRLKAISTDWFGLNPGPPDAPERQKLAAVYDAAVGIASGAATILDQGYTPPSPICEG